MPIYTVDIWDKRDYDKPEPGSQLGTFDTLTIMRCEDCANEHGHASMCRDCCPTGHGTHFVGENK